MNVLYEATALGDGFAEVLKFTTKTTQTFDNADPAHFSKALDVAPTFLDPDPGGIWGRGQMPPTAGVSWLYHPGNVQLRLAAAGDVAAMEAVRTSRRNGQAKDRAGQLLTADPAMRKILAAILRELIQDRENQILRAVNGVRQAILDGNNLQSIKDGVTAVAPIPSRTMEDLRDAVLASLDPND